MGLENFTKGKSNPYKQYSCFELDQQLEDIVEDLQDKFPDKVQVDFIEASPQLSSCVGKAYYRTNENMERTNFIRIKKSLAQENSERTRRVVLHEMCHVYLYQKGFTETSEKDVLFQWLCGSVGADPTHIFEGSKEWTHIIGPMLRLNNE